MRLIPDFDDGQRATRKILPTDTFCRDRRSGPGAAARRQCRRWWVAGRWERWSRICLCGRGWGGCGLSIAISWRPRTCSARRFSRRADAREALPKATAAERRLRAINSDARVEGVVADLTPENSAELLDGFAVILDGTDNFETRLLLNDLAIARNIPWIYAAAVGSYGVTMTIRPGETACLACLHRKRGKSERRLAAEATCDTAGVVNAAVGVIASIEAAEATKLLAGKPEALNQRPDFLRRLERKISIHPRCAQSDCRACGRREFTILPAKRSPTSRCADATRCRFTSAGGGWTWMNWGGGSRWGRRMVCITMNSCCVFAWRLTN